MRKLLMNAGDGANGGGATEDKNSTTKQTEGAGDNQNDQQGGETQGDGTGKEDVEGDGENQGKKEGVEGEGSEA